METASAPTPTFSAFEVPYPKRVHQAREALLALADRPDDYWAEAERLKARFDGLDAPARFAADLNDGLLPSPARLKSAMLIASLPLYYNTDPYSPATLETCVSRQLELGQVIMQALAVRKLDGYRSHGGRNNFNHGSASETLSEMSVLALGNAGQVIRPGLVPCVFYPGTESDNITPERADMTQPLRGIDAWATRVDGRYDIDIPIQVKTGNGSDLYVPGIKVVSVNYDLDAQTGGLLHGGIIADLQASFPQRDFSGEAGQRTLARLPKLMTRLHAA